MESADRAARAAKRTQQEQQKTWYAYMFVLLELVILRRMCVISSIGSFSLLSHTALLGVAQGAGNRSCSIKAQATTSTAIGT
jgi:hypothetical protein